MRDVDLRVREGSIMFWRLIFVAIVCLQAIGCGGYRTAMTVSAETSVYDRSPFHEQGASSRIAYRVELDPIRQQR